VALNRTATQAAIAFARDDLASFATLMHRRFDLAALHRAIIEQLERVQRGEIDRLMIFIPPRHGKSLISSESIRRGSSASIRTAPWRPSLRPTEGDAPRAVLQGVEKLD
jgi:hypothetical protein